MKHYDVIVIGAGSGGLVAATSAHRKGLKTALLEKNKIGGECTHYGCVPSKALINTTKAYHHAQNGVDLGFTISANRPDFATVMEKVDQIVQGIYQHETPEVFQTQGIDTIVHESGAQFLDEYRVQIGKEILHGKNFIICTGSSPRIPAIDGIEQVKILHNENFWDTREHPGKVVFIGGGVISVELGQSLARLGCDVTILDKNSRLLKITDEEIGEYLVGQLTNENIQLELNTTPIRFHDSHTLIIKQGAMERHLVADTFFVAVGRSPKYQGMSLKDAGVAYSEQGGIQTNEYLQTSTPHIYACGDVTTRFKFTHTASHQANTCVHNILTNNSRKDNLSVLPWAVFTDPEIGHVGLSLPESEAKYGPDNIKVFKVDASIDRFITDRKTGGMLKVIFNQEDLVVGAEGIGQHAGEWIQILTIAIKNKIPAQQMADTIFAYPTYSEIVKKAFSRYLRTKG